MIEKAERILKQLLDGGLPILIFRVAITILIVGFMHIITKKEKCYQDTLNMKLDTIILLFFEVIMFLFPILFL